MNAGLGGEGAGADIGRLAQRHAVQDVVKLTADPGQPLQRLGRDAGVIAAGIGFLEQQRRDQRGQVGIAAAFAQTIQRALDLPRTRIDRRQRTGNGVFGVVVAMDAKPVAGDAGGTRVGFANADISFSFRSTSAKCGSG